jgi:hypothetical protein
MQRSQPIAGRRDMSEATSSPQPERVLLSTRREYLEAMNCLLESARKELRIFDADFSALKIDAPQTHELLREFLLRGHENRLYIAVHDTDYIRRYCPRLLYLLQQFSDRMFIHQTQGDAARAQDCFVLADRLHCVRCPVQAQPRAALRFNDEHESQGLLLRFTEIWDSSLPAVCATHSGL